MSQRLKGCVSFGTPDMLLSFMGNFVFFCLFVFKAILGEIRDEDDEILPRKDYEARFQMSQWFSPSLCCFWLN